MAHKKKQGKSGPVQKTTPSQLSRSMIYKFTPLPGRVLIGDGCPKTASSIILFLLICIVSVASVKATPGATVPWTTYEAENMLVGGGTVLGPQYNPFNVPAEASGRMCVQLNGTGQYIQFTNQSAATALVVRYCVPDTADGAGADYTQAVKSDSIYGWAHFALGRFKETKNDLTGAAGDYALALKCDPENLDILLPFAELLIRLDRKEEACGIYLKAEAAGSGAASSKLIYYGCGDKK